MKTLQASLDTVVQHELRSTKLVPNEDIFLSGVVLDYLPIESLEKLGLRLHDIEALVFPGQERQRVVEWIQNGAERPDDLQPITYSEPEAEPSDEDSEQPAGVRKKKQPPKVKVYNVIASIALEHLESFRRTIRKMREPGHGLSYVGPFQIVRSAFRLPMDDLGKPRTNQQQMRVRISMFKGLPRVKYAAILERLQGRYGQRVRSLTLTEEECELVADLRPEEIQELAVGVSSVSEIQQDQEIIIQPSAPAAAPGDAPPLAEAPRQIPILGSVAVVDSGADLNHPWLRPVLGTAKDYSADGGLDDRRDHGTGVAGLAAYGQSFWAGWPPPAFHRVHVCKVYGTQPLRETQLTEALSKAVQELQSECRVFNISLNARAHDPRGVPAPLTEHLDKLAREHDVVFVVSAGNIQNPDLVNFHASGSPYPTYYVNPGSAVRITSPGDAINCLTVGSAALFPTGANNVAPFGHPAPHTRHCHRQFPPFCKPDLCEEGGNLVFTNGNLQADSARMPLVLRANPPTANGPDLVMRGRGTSYSAPLVAWCAAYVAARYPSASANLIRALVSHSAAYDAPWHLPLPKEALLGRGRPRHEIAAFSEPNRVTYVAQGEMDLDKQLDVFIYIPPVISQSKAFRRLRATFAYNPPVDRSLRSEYALVRIHPQLLRPNQKRVVPNRSFHWNMGSRHPLKYAEWEFSSRSTVMKKEGSDWIVRLTPYLPAILSKKRRPKRQKFALVVTMECEDVLVNAYQQAAQVMQPVQVAVRVR